MLDFIGTASPSLNARFHRHRFAVSQSAQLTLMSFINTLRAYYHFSLGNVRRSVGNRYGSLSDYRGAVEAFTRAIELHPTLARAYEARGTLYWRELNEHHNAIADCTRAIELNPRLANAYLNRGLARVYGRSGTVEEKVADFSRYLAIGRNRFLRSEARQQIERLQGIL
jgi:tetratricopeptide (TPR) repeat protein